MRAGVRACVRVNVCACECVRLSLCLHVSVRLCRYYETKLPQFACKLCEQEIDELRSQMATVYKELRMNGKALEIMQQVHQSAQEGVLMGGPQAHVAEHHYANELNNFASLHLEMGNLAKAEEMYEEALDITLRLYVLQH